jgi:hypothetical protein
MSEQEDKAIGNLKKLNIDTDLDTPAFERSGKKPKSLLRKQQAYAGPDTESEAFKRLKRTPETEIDIVPAYLRAKPQLPYKTQQ